MTDSPEQIDSARLHEIMDRFHLITGPPVALHRGDPARQQLLLGTSSCAACVFVNGFPAGARACARSRAAAFTLARDSGQPVAFVCHLGFGCASCAVPGAGNYWITIGPYLPEAAADALEFSVRKGLEAVALPEVLEGSLPFLLTDIPVRPPRAMVEAVLWIAESVASLFPASPETDAPDPADTQATGAVRAEPAAQAFRRVRVGRPVEHRREVSAAGPDFPRLPISRAVPVLWLAGGYQARAEAAWRRIVREQSRLSGRARPDWPILLETATDVLEGCDRLGARTAAAWNTLGVLRAKGTSAQGPPDEAACAKLFRQIRWPAEVRGLFSALCARWQEEIRNADPDLDAAARAVGMSPTTLSQYLRKRLGLSYSGCRSALRAEVARGELERSDKPVRQVAEIAGLTDPANLHRLFRRHGLPSPGLYRWLMRER